PAHRSAALDPTASNPANIVGTHSDLHPVPACRNSGSFVSCLRCVPCFNQVGALLVGDLVDSFLRHEHSDRNPASGKSACPVIPGVKMKAEVFACGPDCGFTDDVVAHVGDVDDAVGFNYLPVYFVRQPVGRVENLNALWMNQVDSFS